MKDSDPTRAHLALFNAIASLYGRLFGFLARSYGALLSDHLHELGLAPGAKVLDVGCGPGAYASAFRTHGFRATGVDGAPKMAAEARRHGIECEVADASRLIPFGDGEFDLALAAYVAHGLTREARLSLYVEMRRVSRAQVLFHDFSPGIRPFPAWSITGILERLERSDYRRFVNVGLEEMREVFTSVRVVEVSKHASWYVCG